MLLLKKIHILFQHLIVFLSRNCEFDSHFTLFAKNSGCVFAGGKNGSIPFGNFVDNLTDQVTDMRNGEYARYYVQI